MDTSGAVKQALKHIDEIADPENGMDKSEYKDFLEELIGDLEGRYESILEELGDE